MAGPPVAETRAALKDAIDQQNFSAFDDRYHAFLNSYDLYRNQDTSLRQGVETFTNPIFGQASKYHLYTTPESEAAPMIARARAASAILAELPMKERAKLLRAVQKRIEARGREIETTITADTGKPINLAEGEMTKGKAWFDWAYANADGQVGQLNGRRKPAGAVQVIGAYNYPYALAIGGIVGGLAAGNGVIVSAPKKAPHWVFPFMQAAQEGLEDYLKAKGVTSGKVAEKLRAGLFQASFGVNPKLTSQVDVVHFVGSDTVGHLIEKSRPGKRTILEMGGTNVVTVLDSAIGAPDNKGKPMTAQSIAASIYGGFGPASGQRCTAPRILCVQNGAETTKVIAELGKLCERDFHEHKLGNPFIGGKDGTQMGPLADRETYAAMQKAIATAKDMGATVAYAGELNPNQFPLARGGCWTTPVMIDWSNVPPERMNDAYKLMKHEIFGPLIHVVKPVATAQEAIAFTNLIDNVNKLAGSVYSKDVADADHFQKATNVTSMKHNEPPKDMSPEQYHGHPDRLRIGGGTHFELYTQGPVMQQGRRFD